MPHSNVSPKAETNSTLKTKLQPSNSVLKACTKLKLVIHRKTNETHNSEDVCV